MQDKLIFNKNNVANKKKFLLVEKSKTQTKYNIEIIIFCVTVPFTFLLNTDTITNNINIEF